ncbi:MAG: amino acid transporter [Caldilineaceae bacterium]|nr:amino acid transporter [Caldilineaceae bacterium]
MLAYIHSQSFLILTQGFLLCAGLIVAIGPQNLFVLQQGLRGQYLFVTALLCTLFDVLLITLGIGGVGIMVATYEQLLTAVTMGGAAFLFGYGVRSLRAAWIPQTSIAPHFTGRAVLSFKGTLLATCGFSLLNPGAYLDTILMIGTTGSRFPFDERILFGAGAVLASGLWFFTLTYGANRLAPLLQRPRVWRALDLVSGCIMVGTAGSLCINQTIWLW